MIVYVIAAAILVSVILLVVCRHVDWKSVNDYNRGYYNEDGDHIYYDRNIIKRKRENQETKESFAKTDFCEDHYDESNYYTPEGDHIYYDRKLIRYKRRHQTESKH